MTSCCHTWILPSRGTLGQTETLSTVTLGHECLVALGSPSSRGGGGPGGRPAGGLLPPLGLT